MSILWIGLASIMKMLNTGTMYIDRTRQEIVAINLAREWIESVYQIRNTNRKRRWGKKDACWLKVDPLSGNTSACENDPRMWSGNYIVQTKETPQGQKYFFLSWTAEQDMDVSYFDPREMVYAMCYGSGQWQPCPLGTQDNVVSEGRFFRQIDGLWLYLKNVQQTGWQYIDCQNGIDTYTYTPPPTDYDCADTVAKEYRFCSIVQYTKQLYGEVKLCGVLTNFLE